MPDLTHTLQGHDLTFLRMVAGLWGVELNASDARTALPALVQQVTGPGLARELYEALPSDAQAAVQALLENEGRLPWAAFARRFGEVRAMGAARRDRERPDLRPASPAEMLWYRALIGRAFLNLTAEPQEYAYIPDELLEQLAPLARSAAAVYGRPASPAERAHPRPAADGILDQACTLLAALRMGLDPASLPLEESGPPPQVLVELLLAAGLLDANHVPLPEPTRAFLEAPRGKALALLAEAWMHSPRFNDLHHVPGLVFEGAWQNDPLSARHTILYMLGHIEPGSWWSLPAFVAAVREREPDFQRPGGDYDSWFVRREGEEQYLRGFATWDEVDGALIRHLITGPLHWLGLLDLAGPAPGQSPTAFRTSAWAADLWNGRAPSGLAEENQPVRVNSGGLIRVPPLAPRALRYQIARFCAWLPPEKGDYCYRVTPEALERAGKQGLRPAHLIALLKKHAAGPLPPGLLQAMERWEQHGAQARMEGVLLLRASSPEVMAAIRQSRAARFLGEELNPTTCLVRPGAGDRVLQALAESGYLAAARLEGQGSQL